MSTVFRPSGEPKKNTLGLTIFVRTLAEARRQTAVGEYVIGWSNSGAARGRWSRQDDGIFRKVAP